MNRDDIIRMAREAGAERNSDFPDWSFEDGPLERFAALVAAALVAAAEREACAQLCESYGPARVLSGEDCAAAIRARGEK
jgi:hypothetical protein